MGKEHAHLTQPCLLRMKSFYELSINAKYTYDVIEDPLLCKNTDIDDFFPCERFNCCNHSELTFSFSSGFDALHINRMLHLVA